MFSRGAEPFDFRSSVWGWLRDLFENGIAVVFVFSSVVEEEGIE
jgi:hypothetical protein